MQADGLQFGVIRTLVAVCVLLFASTIGVNVAKAIGDPVSQPVAADNSNPTGSQSTFESNSAKLSDVPQKEKRKAEVLLARRQVVLDFLEQHFPELRESILKSEKKSPRRSRVAIKRIEKDVLYLQKIQQKQPGKFDLVVQQWKLKTEIEITIAKYSGKETDDQLKSRLKPLIKEMVEVRKSILKFDRQITSNRLDKLDKMLLNLETNAERVAEKRFRSFQTSIDAIRAKQKSKQKNSKAKSNKDIPKSAVAP